MKAFLSGLSLVETLIAVAIILVVMAILFPVSKNFIRQSQGAKCAGNLRQIALAGLTCVNDNHGRLPDMTRWFSSAKDDRFSLFYYLGLPTSGELIERESVFTCPVFMKAYPTQISPYRTYAINRYAVGSVQNDSQEWAKILLAGPPETVSRVLDASKMAFFMDGKPNNLTPSTNHSYRAYAATDGIPADKTPPLHGGGLNVVFLDGHLENITSGWIEAERLGIGANRIHPFWGATK